MSQASIISKTKLIPRDFGESFQARVAGDNVIQRFELPRDNVDPATLVAVVNPVSGAPTVLAPAASIDTISTGQYFLDARAGVITLGTPLPNGSTLTVDGNSYLQTNPADMATWVDIAFQMHTAGQVGMTIDTLPPLEEYLVALLATVEMLWSQAAEAAQEIDVMTPEGVNIPASQRFAQIVTLIERMQEHYKELAAQLNVGPYRIVVSTLRRVSRLTNRLVPIYQAQEFDDRTYPPVRIYPPIDTGLLETE